jgi:thiamine transport system ATP-binding protein
MVNEGLSVRAATVTFGAVTAVDHVSLEVGPGEIVAVLGASGSGKSSLLRAIAGLEPLAGGAVYWDDVNVSLTPVHERGFVVMFQDGQLFPHYSVAGNVGYALHRLPRAERQEKVDKLLRLVALEGFGLRPITALSGGQAQRVALARSLAANPRLLLLDEPLSALDRHLREHLVTVLADILRGTATPALYVTHDQAEAFALADRVAVLDRGKLLQIGTPQALMEHPADPVVAAFLG